MHCVLHVYGEQPIVSSLDRLTTEARNPASEAIDSKSSLEIARLMAEEDARVATAVAEQSESIARAIDCIADRVQRQGRLIYVGAGTSGRLGVLDASECPPTFNTRPEQVVGLIAGGYGALTRSIEGAEDDPERGRADLIEHHVGPADVVVGIATSGRTPYVIGALRQARLVGAAAIGISCNADPELAAEADFCIVPIVGPEVISGSTRLKAGTATKLVLNMLTTGAMVRIGKTFGNLMVDLRATNSKLQQRARRIVGHLTGLPGEDCQSLLERCQGEVKTAIAAHALGVDASEARLRLDAAGGHLRTVLCQRPTPPPATVSDGIGKFFLGVDGGGSKTTGVVARWDDPAFNALGRGLGGPSNPGSVGWPAALHELGLTVRRALEAAHCSAEQLGGALLAIAGTDSAEDRQRLLYWWGAAFSPAVVRPEVTHDGIPILQTGTTDGRGIALICGTGSLAIAGDGNGVIRRCGGWGPLLGDEGSGFWIGRQAIARLARCLDGREPPSRLTTELKEHLRLPTAAALREWISREGDRRERVARLAAWVLDQSVRGDPDSAAIVEAAGESLAELIRSLVAATEPPPAGYDLALSGSLVTATPVLREAMLASLARSPGPPGRILLVEDPAMAAARVARRNAATWKPADGLTQ